MPSTTALIVALVTGLRVPSSINRPRSTAVALLSGVATAGGGGAVGTNVWVNVIWTLTGLPPNVAGSNVNCFTAAITASSNTGCGVDTRSTFATAPVSSTSSLTVTATGAVISGALSGYATSVEPFATGA